MSARYPALLFLVLAAIWAAYTFVPRSLDHEKSVATCNSNDFSPQETVAACSELIKLSGLSVEQRHLFLRNRAWAFQRNGEFENALSDIDLALELDTDPITAWVWRAYINNANGVYDAAANDFAKALEIEPDSVSTLMHRAKLFDKRGEKEKALFDYSRVLEIDPANSKASDRRIMIFLNNGQIDLAVEAMDQEVLRWPENPKTHWRMGVLHYQYTGNSERALAAFIRSDKLEPHSPSTLLYLGATYLRHGNEKLGKPYIEEYALLFEQSSTRELGLVDSAIYNFGVQVLANGGAELFFRGLAYSFAGQPDLARSNFMQSLRNGGRFTYHMLEGSMKDKGIVLSPQDWENKGDKFDEALDEFIISLEAPWAGATSP